MKSLKASLMNAAFYFAGLVFLLFFTFASTVNTDSVGSGRILRTLERSANLENWFILTLIIAASVGIPVGLINGIVLATISSSIRAVLLCAAVSGFALGGIIVAVLQREVPEARGTLSDMVFVTILIGGVFFSVFALCNLATVRMLKKDGEV